MMQKREKSGQSTGKTVNEIQDTGLKAFINKFLRTTSCHVFDYICSHNFPRSSRILHLVIFTFLILLWAYYTGELFTKWKSFPIVISESSKEIPVISQPFPAVTICNLNQAKRSVAETIEANTWDYLRLQILCGKDTKIDPVNANMTSAIEWESFRKLLLKVTPQCDEMLKYCMYGAARYNCSDIFESVLTDLGICCMFNGLDPKFLYKHGFQDQGLERKKSSIDLVPVHFTSENGYEQPLPEKYFPRKPAGIGIYTGLSVVLNASANDYFCSISHGIGFKYLIHAQTEFPQITSYGSLLRTNYETSVMITPTYHTTTDAVRSLPISKRNCIFNAESNLKHFKTYSSGNCELECIAELMENMCGCILYYLPRKSNETKICGLVELKCSSRIENFFKNLSNSKQECSFCPNSCVYLDFNEIVTQSQLLARSPMLDNALSEGYNVSEIAVVHFYYRQISLSVTTMEAYLGFLGFFANSGGLYSLFLGLSLLSVSEIVYFLIALLVKLIERHRKKKGKQIIDVLPNSLDRYVVYDPSILRKA